MNNNKPSEESQIKSIVNAHIDHLDQLIADTSSSKLGYFVLKNQGKTFDSLNDIKWDKVPIKSVLKKFNPSTTRQQSPFALSPTLVYQSYANTRLLLSEIDCYASHVYNHTLVRPTVPLTPKFISVLLSIFDDQWNEITEGVDVVNFPAKNGEPDWDAFKLLARELSRMYPVSHMELMKLREPESIDIGLRESTVATFSKELRELRESTFDYYRKVYELNMLLSIIQRNHNLFKESEDGTPYNYKIVTSLLDDTNDSGLLNIVRSTADVYELNYPETVESTAVRYLMEHVEELLTDAIDNAVTGKSNSGLTYDHNKFADLFSSINIFLELLEDIVELKKYSYYRSFSKIEF